MDNPLKDIAERQKEQKLYNKLDALEKSVDNLRRDTMKLISIEIFPLQANKDATVHTISVNPDQIAFILDDNTHSYIHMSNGTVLHAVASRNNILALIKGDTEKKYVQ